VGVDKTIDTRKYTIVSFDVPGNGFNSATIENYRDFIARDIARIFIEGLRVLKRLTFICSYRWFAELLGKFWLLEPISSKFYSHRYRLESDRLLIANCYLQEQILNNSKRPIEDACYVNGRRSLLR
jgi:hypothetical protein